MNSRIPYLAVLVLALGALAPSLASAQISDLGKIIAGKDKQAAEAVEKAGKSQGKRQGKKKPRAKPAARSEVSRDSATGVIDDPTVVLDITPDVLARFAAGLEAEAQKREQPVKGMTPAKFETAGAEAGGFTRAQYSMLKERVVPFCDAVIKGLDRPDDYRLAYMPTEMAAIKPRCPALVPALQKVH
jgi:hypothetical protein